MAGGAAGSFPAMVSASDLVWCWRAAGSAASSKKKDPRSGHLRYLFQGHLSWEAWPVARTLPLHPCRAAGVPRRRAAGELELICGSPAAWARQPVTNMTKRDASSDSTTGSAKRMWIHRRNHSFPIPAPSMKTLIYRGIAYTTAGIKAVAKPVNHELIYRGCLTRPRFTSVTNIRLQPHTWLGRCYSPQPQ